MKHFLWQRWFEQNIPALQNGNHLVIPHELPHPSDVGFKHIRLAESVGQTRDWGWSLPTGSRVHVHEFDDGHMRAHLDRYDPDRSFGHWLAHGIYESKTVRRLIRLGLVFSALSRLRTR